MRTGDRRPADQARVFFADDFIPLLEEDRRLGQEGGRSIEGEVAVPSQDLAFRLPLTPGIEG
ncbi:hypothetical protein D3C83_226950 [compost metagenome]